MALRTPSVLITDSIFKTPVRYRMVERDPHRPPILEVPEVPHVNVKWRPGSEYGGGTIGIVLDIPHHDDQGWLDTNIDSLLRAIHENIDDRLCGTIIDSGTIRLVEHHVRDLLVGWIRQGVLGIAPDLGYEVWRFDLDVAVSDGIVSPRQDRVWGSRVHWYQGRSKNILSPHVENKPFEDPQLAMSWAKSQIEPDVLVVVQDTMIQYNQHGAFRDTWFSNDGDDMWLWRRYKDGRQGTRRPK